MDIGKPPKMRILTGTPAQLDAELNLLLEQDYAPLERTWFNLNDVIVGVITLIHMSEIRKAQMMQGLSNGRNS
jgi:hypothetical protein